MNAEVPVWMKYTLSIEEAARYFRIGENKLRRIIEENREEQEKNEKLYKTLGMITGLAIVIVLM